MEQVGKSAGKWPLTKTFIPYTFNYRAFLKKENNAAYKSFLQALFFIKEYMNNKYFARKMIYLLGISMVTIATSNVSWAGSVQTDIQQDVSPKKELDLSVLDEDQTKNNIETLKNLFGELIRLLDIISTKIQHISQLTREGRTAGNDNERINATIEWLNRMQIITDTVRQAPSTPLTETSLYNCLKAADIMVRALEDELSNGFSYLPDITDAVNKTLEIKRSLPLEDDLKALAQQLGNRTEKFSSEVANCGISFFNRAYRTISDINYNYKLTHLAFLGTAALAIALPLAFYNLPDSMVPKQVKILREKYTFTGGLSVEKNGIIGGLVHPAKDTFELISFGSSMLAWLYGHGAYIWIRKQLAELDSSWRGNKYEPQGTYLYINNIDLNSPQFDHIREILKPFYEIAKYIEKPEQYALAGIKTVRSFVLIGNPGDGKTFLANAIAGHLNKVTHGKAVFIPIDIDMLAANNGIKNILSNAKEHAPCVVFIDELHSLGLQSDKNSMLLNEFLVELDKVNKDPDPLRQVFFIGATNRPDLLDSALTRPGRMQPIILPDPVYAHRLDLLKAFCKDSAINPESIQIERLAHVTAGISISGLRKLFEQGMFFAKDENKIVSFNHMYRALNKVFRNLSEKIFLSEIEERIVAYHISGMAVAYLTLAGAPHLDGITLFATPKKIAETYDYMIKAQQKPQENLFIPQHGSLFVYNSSEFISRASIQDEFMSCKLFVSGLAAQKIFLGRETSYRTDDRAQAYQEALKVLLSGLKIENFSSKEQDDLKSQAWQKVKECEQEMRQLITAKKDTIEKIAQALLKNKFLRREEIEEIIAQKS